MFGQNFSFSFIYNGPTELYVDETCSATLDWGHPNTPTAFSNLPQGEIVSFEIFSISGGFTEGGQVPPGNVVTIFYEAIDNFGNMAIYGFSITVIDTIPPTFIEGTLPPDIQVGCVDDIPPPASVMADDNCIDAGYQLTVSLAEEGSADACAGGVITRTWVADDDLGNQAEYTQTITVLPDTTGPVITGIPQDGSAECANAMEGYADWIAAQRILFSAEDSGCGDITYEDNAPDPGVLVDFCGEIPVLFSASDGCGNTSTVTATFFLLNETPPTITTEPSDAMASCASGSPEAAFQAWIADHAGADAIDDCGSVQWFTIPPDPTIRDTCVSGYTIEFIADDGCGNTTSVFSTFTVIDTTGPEITTEANNRIVTCSSSDVTFELGNWLSNAGGAAASDLCTDPEELEVAFLIGGNPVDSAEIFDILQDSIETGCRDGVIIGGIIFNNMLALLEVEFLFRDKCGNGTGSTALFGLLEGLPPEIIAPAADELIACDITVSVEEAFGNWYQSAGGAEAVDDCGEVLWRGEPPLDEAFGQLSAALDTSCGADAFVEVRFFAMDFCGLESDTFTTAAFGIIDTLAPTLVSPAVDLNISCEEGGVQALVNWLDTLGGAMATDECAALEWVFSYTNRTGDTLSGIPGTGPYPALSDLDCSATNLFHFQATDFCGNSVMTTAGFLLVDTVQPVIFLEQDTLSVSCDLIPGIEDITVTDNCSAGAVDVTFEDILVGDTSTIDCAGYLVLREWVATDDCGNTSVDTLYLRIVDEEAPTFTAPPDTVISCAERDSIPVIPPGDLADNCDTSPSVSYSDSISVGECADEIFRTWTIMDACGNAATAIQRISFFDSIPPVFQQCMDTLMVAVGADTCAGVLEITPPTITDNCTGQGMLSYQYRLGSGDFQPIGLNDTIEVIISESMEVLEWQAFDCAGNTAVCATTVLVEDAIPPEITCPDGIEVNLMDSCSLLLPVPAPLSIADNCQPDDLSLAITVTGATEIDEMVIPPGTDSIPVTFQAGMSIIRYAVQDPFGNADSCQFEVFLRDQELPVARCRDLEVTISPDGLADLTISTGELDAGSTDNCGPVELVMDPVIVSCDQIGTVLQSELIAVDAAGNQDTCMSAIRVLAPETVAGFSLDVCDPDTLRLFAQVPGEASAFAFAWTGPGNFTSSLENPILLGVDTSNSGTYSLTLTGQTGCVATDSVSVVISSSNVPALSAPSDTYCLGDTINFMANQYAGEVSYIWYQGAFPDGEAIDTSGTPQLDLAASETGISSYYLLVSSADCQIGPSDDITIEVFPVPEAMLQAGDTTLCAGDSIVLQSLNGDPDLEYTWNGPQNFFSKLQNPDPFAAMPGAAGTYTLSVSSNGCVSATEAVTIAVSVPPDQPVISGNDLYCAGESLELMAQVEMAADSFTWYSPDGFTFTTTGSDLLILESLPSMSGPWSVVAFSNDCPSDTSAAFEVNFEMTENVFAVNSGPVCAGEDVTIGFSMELPGAAYDWSGPNAFESTTAENIISPAVAGSYSVFVQTAGGCDLEFETEVQLIGQPVVDTIIGDFETCADGVSPAMLIPEVSVQGLGPIAYAWSGPAGIGTDSILVLDSLDASKNGVYYLSVSEGGCAPAVDSITVNVTNIPEKPEITSDQTQWCTGDTIIIQSTIAYPPGAVYIWTASDGTIFETGNSILALPDVDMLAGGAYTLAVRVDNCVSEPADSIELTVLEPPPAPQINAASRVCAGDTLFLSVEGGPVPGGVYTWTGPGGFTAMTAEPFIYPVTGVAEGNYTVDLMVGPCRTNTSDAFFVEVVPRPATPVIETGPEEICLDDPGAVEICISEDALSAGATYQWFLADQSMQLGQTQARCFDLTDFTLFEEGSNSILVQAEVNGCQSFTSAVQEITGYVFPEEAAQVDDNLLICPDETPLVMAAPVANSQGQWSSIGGLLEFENDTGSVTQVFGLSEGGNSVIWTLSFAACRNFSADTAVIFVEPRPGPLPDSIIVEFGQTRNFNVVSNDALPPGYVLTISSGPSKGNALHRGDGDFVYTPDIGFVGLDSLSYEVCSEMCPDQCMTTSVYLVVGDENDCFVPTIFTPNEDGVNDRFVIPCLEAERHPDNRVIIFNQWGDEVFSASPYRNDWAGQRDGKDLPVSTYYYIVDFGDGSEVRKGFLILER